MPAAREPVLSVCERTLRSSWASGERDGAPFHYTRPSRQRYPWQWYWDSCFDAIAWRRFDAERSRQELESLLRAATPDGFIGHAVFWEHPVDFPRTLFYNVVHRHDFMTGTIQPPLLAWAWRIAVGDPADNEGIVRHQDWVERHRDLDGDGLIWLVQPDESGLDASPQFDPIWRWRAQGIPGFMLLVRRNRRLNFDIRRIEADGGPLCCEVMTNVLHGLSRLALGRPSITPALVERLYDEQRGAFLPAARPQPTETIPLTWAALSPLALPDLPEDLGRRLVDEHLLDRERFRTQVAPPSVALCEPSFTLRDRFWGLRRYWRGPTWAISTWLVWLGVRRLGYEELAGELVEGFAGAVEREGLREYYDPSTGAGMGAHDWTPCSLVSELVDPDPRAATSYV